MCFIDAKGERTEVKGKIGDNLLYLAHRYNIPLEGKVSHSFFSLIYKKKKTKETIIRTLYMAVCIRTLEI